MIPAVLFAIGSQAPLLPELETRDGSGGLDRFAPLALVAAICLAAARSRRSISAGTGPAVLLCVAGVLLTGTAIAIRSPAVAAAAFVVTLLFGVEAIGGPGARRSVFAAWLGLWLAVPTPIEGLGRPVDAIQAGLTGATSAVLDLSGVRHRIVGGAVEMPARTFTPTVEAETVFVALGAVCAAAAALRRGPAWSAVLVGTAAFWWFAAAVVAEALPILTAHHERGGEIEGPEWWPAAATVSATLLLAWSTDRWLSWLMPHGGLATWRSVHATLEGEPEPDESFPGGRDSDAWGRDDVRSPFTKVGAMLATAAFAATAALWLVPPVPRTPTAIGPEVREKAT